MKFGEDDGGNDPNKLIEAFFEFRPQSRVMGPRWGEP